VSIVLAGLAAAVFGIADFLGGTAARRVPSAVVAMLAQLAGLLALGMTMIMLPAEVLPSALGWGLLAGLAGGIGVPMFYRGLAEGSMNVVAPLAALTSAAVPVVAGALFGERPSTSAWVGIGLAVVAGVVVGISLPPGETPRAASAASVRGVVLALLSGVCFGGFFVLISQAEPAAGLWPVTAAKMAGSLVAGGTLLVALRAGGVLTAWRTPVASGVGPVSTPARPAELAAVLGSALPDSAVTDSAPSAGSALLDSASPAGVALPNPAPPAGAGWWLAAVGGVLDAAANALYLLAVQRGQLAVVGAVVALYPASTVLLARLLHGERVGPVQRVGLALAVPALVLVGAG
jgi:uncharacterized membrane protein